MCFFSLIKIYVLDLTDGIFETGAYGVPSKSQNKTFLGQGHHSCSDKLPLTPHNILVISILILAKK